MICPRNGAGDDFADLAIDQHDIDALAALRGTLSVIDPVPDGLVERIEFEMTVAALQAEVARIVQPEASVRSVTYEKTHTVTFASDSLSVMVTIDDAGPLHARITGWCTIPHVRIECRSRSVTQTAEADEEGRFEFESIERGFVTFVVHPDDGRHPNPIITPAIDI